MRSFSTAGLILLACLSWAASPVSAQTSPYNPSLLPWPSAAPVASPNARASYFSNPGLSDPNGMTYPAPPADGSTQFTGTIDEALHSPDCGDCGCCTPCRGCNWFGGVAGLVMGRNRSNPYWTTFETNNNPNQLMNTQNAGADWAGGGMFTVGYLPCGCCGPSIAFTYWGLAPMTGLWTTVAGGPIGSLSTPIDLRDPTTGSGQVEINGVPANIYFDGARRHTITRSDNYNDFELNGLTPFYSIGRLQFAGLAGFRYLRFSDSLLFTSENFAGDSASLGFKCINNLYGFQLGAVMSYQIWDRVGVFVLPKAGIYGNQMNCQTLLYSDINNPQYNILSHKTDVSFIGELDAGLSYAFASNWRAFIGYRVVGIANVALADNQFLPFLADTAGFAQVKQNGGLILHGAFFGVGWVF
jgi:hypothetical protein